jgi:molybdopterin/thiamine biosynthesis adenylyltransferase
VDHTRHIGIFDCSSLAVTLVGAGGIGAMTALMLAKMGVAHLVIYDGDTVSPENMPTQLHRLGDLGRGKVFGVEEIIQTFSDDTTVYPVDARVTANLSLSGTIVISAVDSIAARKDIWKATYRGSCAWYIDARMSAEEFQMHCVNMNDAAQVDKYAKMIDAEDDSKIPDIPCTAKATFFCAAIAAGQIGGAVRKIITGLHPAKYLIHNILNDKLFHLGDA